MMVIEQNIKMFIAYEDRPLVILEFPLNVTVQEALNQICIVLDISDRDANDRVLRMKFGRTELRSDWFLYDCCLPVGATVRVVYVQDNKPSFYVNIPVFNETLPIASAVSLPTATVARLRSLVSAESGLPVSMFRLLRTDKTIMHDGHTLLYYNLELGDTVIAETWKGWDEFVIAARHGFADSLLQLIEEDSTVIGTFRAKVSLFMAAHYGHIELASELMKLGYPASEPIGEHPYRQWCISETLSPPHADLFKAPIHVAADRGQLGILRAIVSVEPSALMAKFNNMRALNFCLRKGHKKCATFLIAKSWSKIAFGGGFLTLGIIHQMKKWASRARATVFLCKGTISSTLRRRPPQWAPLLTEGLTIDSPQYMPLDLTSPLLVSNNPKYQSLPPITFHKIHPIYGPGKLAESRRSSMHSTASTLEVVGPSDVANISVNPESSSIQHSNKTLEPGSIVPKSWRPVKQASNKLMLAIVEEQEEHHQQKMASSQDGHQPEVCIKTAVKDSVTSLLVGRPSRSRTKDSILIPAIEIADAGGDEALATTDEQQLTQQAADENKTDENIETTNENEKTLDKKFSVKKTKRKRPLVKMLSVAMVQRVLEEQTHGGRMNSIFDAETSDFERLRSVNSSDDLSSIDGFSSSGGVFVSRLNKLRRSRSLYTKIPASRVVPLLGIDDNTNLAKEPIKETEVEEFPDAEEHFAKTGLKPEPASSIDLMEKSEKNSRTSEAPMLQVTKSVPVAMVSGLKSEKPAVTSTSLAAHVSISRTVSDSTNQSGVFPPIAAGVTSERPSLQASSQPTTLQLLPTVGSRRSLRQSTTTANSIKNINAKERILAELIAQKSKTLACPIPLPAVNHELFSRPWVNPRKLNTEEDPNQTVIRFNQRYRPDKDSRTAAIEQLYRANQFSSLKFLKRVSLAIEMSQRKVRQALGTEN